MDLALCSPYYDDRYLYDVLGGLQVREQTRFCDIHVHMLVTERT